MDTPTISRSGRLVKKSAKVKEMEDFDITDLETQGSKSRKKFKSGDDFDEFDEKRIQPIKIPKISLNVSSASTSYSVSPSKKKSTDNMHSISKIPPFPSPVKSTKLDPNRPLFQESSPETSKGFGSSSMSSESSTSSSSTSSSSDDSEGEYNVKSRQQSKPVMKSNLSPNLQKLPVPQEKVIVESYKQQFNSPLTFVDQNADLTMYGSEEETSESNLVIAEESVDSSMTRPKDKKGSAAKRKPAKKPAARQSGPLKPKPQKKKPPAKDGKAAARKKADQANKDKKVTAYMLWCSENRKRIVAQNPVLFSSISKKMGEIWQALPEKEKMAWRRKAKKLSQKGAELISTGRPVQPPKATLSSLNESTLPLSPDMRANIGTAPIDVAAYLKLLGESLSIIGQRLTEHEGQIAVSGIFSVLLDSTLCALGPLLCLTSESKELNGCPQETLSKVLDNIAYFMPGL